MKNGGLAGLYRTLYSVKSILLIFMLKCLALLPLSVIRQIGALLGWLSWKLSSRMAVTTKINIDLCFPEMSTNERTMLAKSSILETFSTIVEAAPAWLWSEQEIKEHILEVEGLELLEEAVALGNGVVVLVPHLGNWEVFGLYLNNCGCGQSSQLYQAPKDKRLDRMIYAARSRVGAKMHATDSKGVGMLLKSLKRGEVIAILPDQVPDKAGGEFAPFFSNSAFTMTLVPRLIEKTGAKALVGYAARIEGHGKQGWKIIFRKIDEKIYAGHIHDNLLTPLSAMNRSIEKAVKEYPTQYQWEYKRFKKVPTGNKKPY
jgi:KDO2-lipid IV(A) lauroyltransferase